MARYRTTLDAGGAETRAERLKAEGRLRAITRKREISEKEIAEMIPRLAEMAKVIKKADRPT
ncbi:hypothetical protein GCM10027161_00180 [Microbispora hainanensis]